MGVWQEVSWDLMNVHVNTVKKKKKMVPVFQVCKHGIANTLFHQPFFFFFFAAGNLNPLLKK